MPVCVRLTVVIIKFNGLLSGLISYPGIETDIRHGNTIEPFTGSIVQRTGGLLFSFLF